MSWRYIDRALEPVLRKAAAEFPVVVLTGPRQSLEPPDVRMAASADPRGFLGTFSAPVILDEIQYAPELLPYVKEAVDARRHDVGQYLLTGSQNLLMLERVSESLAGRAAVLRLLPLSRAEESAVAGALWPEVVRGYYPELVSEPGRDVALWHAGYVQTYLERDVRTLRQVGDLTQFQSFLRALAARSGQLLNMADLSRDLGIALNTVRQWISVLEATFQVLVLRPYFANVGRRLVKTPKVYYMDTGTLCYLVGLRDPEHAAAGPLGGALFETLVLGEIAKAMANRGEEARVYFWRTSSGWEVDFLVETGGRLTPIEVKSGATPQPRWATGIKVLREALGDAVGPGYVVHPGDLRLPLAEGVTALPLAELPALLRGD
jgi:predicted AAA+ superfamily ATPase